jgi:hypothetical protein
LDAGHKVHQVNRVTPDVRIFIQNK